LHTSRHTRKNSGFSTQDEHRGLLGLEALTEAINFHYATRSIYARLERWGSAHKSVNHGRGEYARDEDGDGFCEVHVNTMEGFWSLLRSWLRPHRGISQEKLPLYLGFFEFVHNVRRRGKALLGSLIELLISKDPGIQ
jgi:transposase-like protein